LSADIAHTDMLVAVESGPLPAAGIVQMNYFQFVKPDILVETCQCLIDTLLGVKVHPCCIAVTGIETNTQPFPLFHSINDFSDVRKVGTHAIPLPSHILQEYPWILLDAFDGQVQRVGDPLQTNISSHA